MKAIALEPKRPVGRLNWKQPVDSPLHTFEQSEPTVDTPFLENTMDYAAQAESVRKIVLSTLAGWGVGDPRSRSVHVTDVLRGGTAIGRRYEIDGFRAMWLWDRDVIVFWGDASQLLKTVSVSEALAGIAKVA
jgi:hypothetical protein